MLTMILLFIVLSSGAVFGCFVLKKEYRFEEYFPLSCMVAVLWLFAWGLLKALFAGFIALMILCGLFYLLAVIRTVVDRDFTDRKSLFFTQGFAFSILIFAAVTWISYGMQAHSWDEFSHWALVVKEMNFSNVLPCFPEVKFTFYKTYPPAMPLFQYLVQKLNGGEFTEWLLYSAYQILLLSFFAPFLEKLNLKKWYNWLFVPAIALVPMMFYENVYSELYIDPFLCVATGACFAMILSGETEKRLGRLTVLFGIATVVLTKEIGILLAAFVVLAFVTTGKSGKPAWSIAFLAVPELLWKLMLKLFNVTGQKRGRIDIASFFSVIAGREDSYRPQTLKAFFIYLRYRYLVIAVVLIVLLLAVCILRKKIPVFWSIMAMGIMYIFGMLLMYMYMFTWQEAISMASYERYIGVVFEAAAVCIVLCAVDLPLKARWLVPTLLLTIACLLIPHREVMMVISRGNVSLARSVREPVEENYCKKIREEYESGSRICYGSGDSATMEFFESRYILAPDYDIYWKDN